MRTEFKGERLTAIVKIIFWASTSSGSKKYIRFAWQMAIVPSEMLQSPFYITSP